MYLIFSNNYCNDLVPEILYIVKVMFVNHYKIYSESLYSELRHIDRKAP